MFVQDNSHRPVGFQPHCDAIRNFDPAYLEHWPCKVESQDRFLTLGSPSLSNIKWELLRDFRITVAHQTNPSLLTGPFEALETVHGIQAPGLCCLAHGSRP